MFSSFLVNRKAAEKGLSSAAGTSGYSSLISNMPCCRAVSQELVSLFLSLLLRDPFSKRRDNTLCVYVCRQDGEVEREWASESARRALVKCLGLSLLLYKWEYLRHREDDMRCCYVKTQHGGRPRLLYLLFRLLLVTEL